MKSNRLASRCKICGKEASVSKWWTKAKSGKVYYYLKYQHSPHTFHLVPTDSTYSHFIERTDKAKNLYSLVEDFITRKMRQRRFRYTALIREMERIYKIKFSNEEFNRALKKATIGGLIEKVAYGRRALYTKASPISSVKEIIFDRVAINYNLGVTEVIVTVFLEVTNNASTPLENVPFYVPKGMVSSLNDLRLSGHDELGILSKASMKIVLPMSMQTLISISLNRTLSKSEQEYLTLSYEIPRSDEDIRFIAPARINSMRITTVSVQKFSLTIGRILVDGARETILPFRRKCFSKFGINCLEIELDRISKGESISIKVGAT